MVNPSTQPSQAAREDEGPIADAARMIASWAEGQTRINVYRAAKETLARFERDTEKRVRESVGAAPDNIRAIVLKHTRVGGYPDTAAIARDAFAAGQNYCRESLAGEANGERVAEVLFHNDAKWAGVLWEYAPKDIQEMFRSDALAALATLERTTDEQ